MYLRWNDACYVEGKLYISACNMNGLFSIDVKTHELKFITHFPLESRLCLDLHSKVISKENTLYFIPLNGTGISIVHLPECLFTHIASEVKFVNALMYKDSIYLIPYQLVDGIWKYLIGENVLVKTDLNVLGQGLYRNNDSITDWYGSLIIDDYLYIAISGTGNISKVNLLTGESTLIKFEGVQFANIYYYKEWFYITDNQYSCLYKTKMKKNDIVKIKIPGEEKTRAIYRVVDYNNSIICIPCFGDTIYQYYPDNDEFQVLYSVQSSEYIDCCQTKYAGTTIAEEKLLLLPKGDFRIIELGIESSVSYEFYFNDFFDVETKCSKNIVLYENKMLDVADYIRII